MATDSVQTQTAESHKTRLNFEEAKTLADWVTLINDQNNPPLGENVAAILKFLPSEPVDLPSVLAIFESEELSNKILRMANEAYFNPAESDLSNIKRVMVVLGLRSVRCIGLCMALYTYLLKNSQDDAFMKEIAIALQSTILAGVIAKRKIRSLNCEPLITASLLFPLGKLLFLSFGGANAKKYTEQLAQGSVSDEEEQAIAGFLLKNLTIEISEKWFIGPTLSKAQEANKDDDIVRIIHLARGVIQAMQVGWESSTTEEALREVSSWLAISFQQARQLALEANLRALETSALLSEKLLEYIPLAEEPDSNDNAQSSDTDSSVNASRIAASIQEMAILLGNQKSPSMSEILAIGLRNLRSSLDVDRAVFALLSHDKLSLKAKSIDEIKHTDFFNSFKFDLNASEGWLFNYLLHEQRSCWVGHETEIAINKLRNHSFNVKVGKGSFLITPFILKGNIMGFYYVDRQISSRKLDSSTFQAFKELCITINGFVELIMARERLKK
ncbi:HDOD domain-containing protein [Candidatus Berkiella aquae]|uniref:HDOD domain protein n=1 Tax=Candidatus Berkiella aquae TaxID=295108 RepID=A0A0Q9YKU6_9GAMM|nr:HDOD domain-containing protein [Candidatus Berkiella aquae]MCS5711717.1 HDOD domain-containing protein [Candidatus Berkiella aquae]